MAPSGGGSSSSFRSPPSLRPRHSFPPLTALRKLCGVFFTLSILVLLLISCPIFLAIRFFGFLKRKSRRWTYRIRICSHQWPFSGIAPDVGIMALTSDVEDSRINFNLSEVSLGEDEFAGEFLFGLGSNDVAKQWDQLERRMKNPKDLVAILNESNVFPKEKTEIRVVTEWNDPGRSSCLVLISSPPRSCVCIPRLFSVLSNQRMYLEMEPLPAYHFFVPIRHTYCLHNFIVVSFRLLTSGPSSLLSLLLKRPSPLWRQLTGEEVKNNGKRRNMRTRDSSSDPMGPEEVVVHSSKENGSLRNSSLLNQEPSSSHYRCGRTVPSGDLVGRAERLLRATSAEMMLALVAGALRRYFREQGIPHPPDLGVLVPVSCRNFLPIACGYPCDVMTFPLMLPTGVEGTIPRIWSVQRRLYEGLNRHKPAALKLVQLFVRACIVEENADPWMKSLFSAHSIHVAFYRASGDFKVSGIASVESMLFFPSLDEDIKASFVFIQCGRNTQICASLCRKTFPDPSLVLDHFEKETHHLLDHLSLRLLSLPQSTFLPGVFPEEPPETMTSASDYLREKTTPKKSEPSECSLEELHDLLSTVQTELDDMRSNPQGDRAEYIRKLSALESRMQQFHDSITEKLGMEGIAEPEGGQVVETILAPYRDAPGSSQERRYSRDSGRTTNEQRLRKASRTSI